jgi:hypothetical protein
MERPSIAMIPSAYNDGIVYSVLPINGAGDLDFARATSATSFNATRVESDGDIQEVGEDIPRLDYSGSGCPSLLLEPESTNLIKYSEDFSNSYWSKGNITFQQNSELQPNGQLTGNSVTFDSLNGYIRQFSTVNAGQKYVFSCWVKSNKEGEIRMARGQQPLDGDDIVVTTNWKRFEVIITPTSSIDGGQFIKLSANQLDYIEVFGAQLEQLLKATSYIPTSGAIGTRVAETLSKNNLSNYINSSEGVLYAELQAISEESDSDRFIYIGDNTATHDNFISIVYKDAGGELAAYGVRNGAESFYIGTTDYTLTDNLQVAVKWKENDCQLYVNGNLVNTDNSTQDFNFTFTDLKTRKFLGESFYGNIRDLRVYTTALTDEELTQLTS